MTDQAFRLSADSLADMHRILGELPDGYRSCSTTWTAYDGTLVTLTLSVGDVDGDAEAS